MPTVALLCQQEMTYPDADTTLLVAALSARGIDSTVIDWRAAADAPTDLSLVRSAWDYHQFPDEFVATLRRVSGPVANPVPVIEWNLHKGYLLDLAAADVPVVPTWLLRRGEGQDLPDVGGPMVIKPAVSAGADATERFDTGGPAATAHLQSILETKDVLVQPLLDLTADGERSLLYLGGRYSHTIRKMPATGDFRVQIHHGGAEFNDTAHDAELAVAEQALAAVPGGRGGSDLLYARIDLAGPRDAPLLMELELIEPQLFLDRADGAADQLAQAIATRVH